MLIILFPLAFCSINTTFAKESNAIKELYISVMDPLAAENACDCVRGSTQRDYNALGQYISKSINMPVKVIFNNSIDSAKEKLGQYPHIIIGKQSAIRHDARSSKRPMTHIADLSDDDGKTTQFGLFITLSDSDIESLEDISGRPISLGPINQVEKHDAAINAMREAEVEFDNDEIMENISQGCPLAAMKVIEEKVDIAVISSYAMPLTEGCKIIEKGKLKIIGKTREVPFIGVFVSDKVTPLLLKQIRNAFQSVNKNKTLLVKMESKNGFVLKPEINGSKPSTPWIDWRGNRKRNSIHSDVPSSLPARIETLWSVKLQSKGVGGIAATDKYVILSDKSKDNRYDIWLCLKPKTGEEIWKLTIDAPNKDMDHTSSPRATPVIADEKVYLFGALGHLYCINIKTGDAIWNCNILDKFGGELPTRGFCGTPLLVDGLIILQTSSKKAATVALDAKNGNVIWMAVGNPIAYGNLVCLKLGGIRQIIGLDALELRGWDIKTGRVLWNITVAQSEVFNVPTPIKIGENLLIANEMDGTRLYTFNTDGTIVNKPIAVNEDYCPDITSPIHMDNKIYLSSYDGLICLGATNKLKELWVNEHDDFCDAVSFIGGNKHLLIATSTGGLCLISTDNNKPIKPFVRKIFTSTDGFDTELWSHPALCGKYLYLRNENEVICLILK